MISLYPFDIEMTQPPIKCSADREIVLQALTQMMDSTHTTYCNEPRIKSREGFNVVHGELDLLLGDTTDVRSSHVIVLTEDGGKEGIVDPEISETKSAAGRRLAAKRLTKKLPYSGYFSRGSIFAVVRIFVLLKIFAILILAEPRIHDLCTFRRADDRWRQFRRMPVFEATMCTERYGRLPYLGTFFVRKSMVWTSLLRIH